MENAFLLLFFVFAMQVGTVKKSYCMTEMPLKSPRVSVGMWTTWKNKKECKGKTKKKNKAVITRFSSIIGKICNYQSGRAALLLVSSFPL